MRLYRGEDSIVRRVHAELIVQRVEQLCADIREFLLENVSKTGGHLASNLGAVELTVALHRVFTTPQDEIVFDPAFFAFEPDSVLTRSGVKTSTLHLRDGRQAVYMSFISYGSAADWAGETVLGSFRLRVLAEDGTGALCSSNYLVSSQDGMIHFPAGAEDAAVVVSELCRVTFQTNGGGDIPPQMVYRGNALTLPEMPARSSAARSAASSATCGTPPVTPSHFMQSSVL